MGRVGVDSDPDAVALVKKVGEEPQDELVNFERLVMTFDLQIAELSTLIEILETSVEEDLEVGPSYQRRLDHDHHFENLGVLKDVDVVIDQNFYFVRKNLS